MTDTLQSDVVLLAKACNAISKGLADGGLGGAWEDLQALLAVKDIDFSALKAAISGLAVDPERQAVEAAFVGALSMAQSDVQAKIVAAVSIIESAIEYAERGVELYKAVVALIQSAKTQLGL